MIKQYILFASLLATVLSVHAQIPEAAGKFYCMGCHTVDAKLVGPAFKAIAVKYKNQPNAADYLVQKIKSGSSGVWGGVAMPPNLKIPEQDVKSLANWILTLG